YYQRTIEDVGEFLSHGQIVFEEYIFATRDEKDYDSNFNADWQEIERKIEEFSDYKFVMLDVIMELKGMSTDISDMSVCFMNRDIRFVRYPIVRNDEARQKLETAVNKVEELVKKLSDSWTELAHDRMDFVSKTKDVDALSWFDEGKMKQTVKPIQSMLESWKLELAAWDEKLGRSSVK